MTAKKRRRIRLAAWRHLRGLSQRDLAEKAGIGQQAVSALERGAAIQPHRLTQKALARALRCKPDDLFHEPQEV